MDIKRIFDKDGKFIIQIILIIIFTFIGIKSLNSYYEKEEEIRKKEIDQDQATTNNSSGSIEENYTVESNSIETTINSFVNYCNNREVEKAYQMLTQECKNAMFPTIEDFEKIYINNIYNVKRTYEYIRWATDGNKAIYLVTLYGDILAIGNTDNFTQEYYTFIEDNNGNYKLNINNYIYGEDSNIQKTVKNITIKIEHIDIYEEYQYIKMTVTNNSSKTICLTGNEDGDNIYLQNSNNIRYSSLNSKFDKGQDVLMEPNSTQIFYVQFNKIYSSQNKVRYLILDDIILDYEDYLKCEDKANYINRTSIKIDYIK